MRRLIVALALAALPAWAQEEEAPAPVAEDAPAPETAAEVSPPEPGPVEVTSDAPAVEEDPAEVKPAPKRVVKPKRKRARVEEKPAPTPVEVERAVQEPVKAVEARTETQAPGGTITGTGERPLTVEDAARTVAVDFLQRMIAGDARTMVELAALPFHLEGTRLADREAVFTAWLKALREKRVSALTLYGVDLYTPDEMEAKYGKPPERLGALPWRGSNTWIAVANVSGRSAVLVLKQVADMDVRVVAFTD